MTVSDIDFVAVSWRPWVLKRRILEATKTLLYSRQAFKSKTSRGMGQMKNEWFQLFSMRSLIEKHFGKGKFKLKYIDHHLSHAASAFYVSPYENAAVFTVDGAGEEETTVFWKGEGTRLTKIKAIKLPHSMGQFYAAITAFLGFKVQSDEYKVMGLASYGKPITVLPWTITRGIRTLIFVARAEGMIPTAALLMRKRFWFVKETGRRQNSLITPMPWWKTGTASWC